MGAEGHIEIPKECTGLIIIPNGKRNEIVRAIPRGTSISIGCMAANASSISSMSPLIDDSTR